MSLTDFLTKNHASLEERIAVCLQHLFCNKLRHTTWAQIEVMCVCVCGGGVMGPCVCVVRGYTRARSVRELKMTYQGEHLGYSI